METDLGATGGGGVDEDPFILAVFWAVDGWSESFVLEVSFSDPGSLLAGENYGDGVAGGLEGFDERVHKWG